MKTAFTLGNRVGCVRGHLHRQALPPVRMLLTDGVLLAILDGRWRWRIAFAQEPSESTIGQLRFLQNVAQEARDIPRKRKNTLTKKSSRKRIKVND